MKAVRFTPACLLAIAGTCAAQSSVTIYGIVDLGITKTNNGNSLSPGSGTPGQWNEQSGYQSRLGFKGREDLGDGMYTRFDLQHRFAADTGVAAPVFWGARSIVALGGRFGEVYLGREYTPASWVAISADPTGWNYMSQISQYTYAGYNAGLPADYTFFRRANSVGYKSPDFKGLTSELAVSAGEGARKRTIGFNVQYKSAPVYAGLAFDGTNAGDDRMWIATLGCDFGFIRLVISYANAKGGVSSLYTGAKDIALSASVPIGLGRFYFGGARLTPIVANSASTKVLAGYEYYLSKLTTLYTNVASAKTQGFTSAGDERRRTSGFDVGITKSF